MNQKRVYLSTIQAFHCNKMDQTNTIFTTYLIDNLFYISIPKTWNHVESDRFRAVSEDGNTLLTVSNYQYENSADKEINQKFLEHLILPMFEDFETNSGYLPLENFESNDRFITKSFRVDNETQYFLSTARLLDDSLIITSLQIRDVEEYNADLKNLLQVIFESIQFVS